MPISITKPMKCQACRDGVAKPFSFSMAFQPIVDVEIGKVFAFEALVRGVNNESASSILAQVTRENRYAFEQSCRVAAITLAKRLNLDATGAKLSINFIPGAVYSPEACLQLTLRTANELSFPTEQLIFEITEAEEVKDTKHLAAIFAEYRRHGFKMALDDFGAGFSGLKMFAEVTPDIVKIDLELVRDLHLRPVAEAITRAVVDLCNSLKILVVAEGVETVDEYFALRRCGVRLMQGHLLAKPAFEALPDFILPQQPAWWAPASELLAGKPATRSIPR
jgi:EAL domain-containing protein (putative c-di-GMP-specific phosphodiesterase class I)